MKNRNTAKDRAMFKKMKADRAARDAKALQKKLIKEKQRKAFSDD